jgi:excisionase family DNA binding protein
MIPISIEIKIQDDLIKEFILDIYKTLESQNHESKKQNLSYIKTLDIELLTIKDVSKLLKTDEPTIRRLIDKGFLKALKLGRLKIRKTEIERFLEWAEGKDFSDLANIKKLSLNKE